MSSADQEPEDSLTPRLELDQEILAIVETTAKMLGYDVTRQFSNCIRNALSEASKPWMSHDEALAYTAENDDGVSESARLDSARLTFLDRDEIELVTRVNSPVSKWRIRIVGRNYDAPTLRERIDKAANALDMEIRPNEPVRFTAAIRRYKAKP
jgi:hypothetical protein